MDETTAPQWEDDDIAEWRRKKTTATTAYEEQALIFLLRRYGSCGTIEQIRRTLQEGSGDRDARVSFRLFRQVYPLFPLQFSAVRLLQPSRDLTMERLFKRFTKTKLYKEYETHVDILRAEEAALSPAVVFHWPAVAKFTVMHTFPRDMIEGTFISKVTAKQTFVIEPLESLLQAVEWSPDC